MLTNGTGAARPRRAFPGQFAVVADRVTEWTESRNWTESTETYGAERSALLLSKKLSK